jgi:hypothetical protein
LDGYPLPARATPRAPSKASGLLPRIQASGRAIENELDEHRIARAQDPFDRQDEAPQDCWLVREHAELADAKEPTGASLSASLGIAERRCPVQPDLRVAPGGPPAAQAQQPRPGKAQRFLAVAFPPWRPAAFFWAVVPPWEELPPDPDFLPPRLDAPGEFAMRAARSFDMPLSLSASYCFSFFTLGRLFGT